MPSNDPGIIGILGAGRVGLALARQTLRSGFEVLIATGKPPSEILLTVATLAPGARAVSTGELVRDSDIVILAVPLRKYASLPPTLLAGKIVVDAMNYWAPSDGLLPEFEATSPSSLIVQHHLLKSRVVRTLNHLGYHEFEVDRNPPETSARRALAIASDDDAARDVVARLVDRLGFDPIDAGALVNARAFEPGTAIFGTAMNRSEMRQALAKELPSVA